ASIDSMERGAKLQTRHGEPIPPWRSERKLCEGKNQATAGGGDCSVRLGEQTQTVTIAKLAQGRNVVQVYDGKCQEMRGKGAADSNKPPDVNNCPSAGVSIDLFPSTIIYVTATVVDPNAKHWDPAQKKFVTGPVQSFLFYQIAGRHPDLNRNGIDDFIDILQGHSKDTNGDGVPDEAQHCLKQLRELEACEAKEGDERRILADVERQEIVLASCEQTCQGKPGEEACEKQCDERREKLDGREHEVGEHFRHQAHECREALHNFKHCEEEYVESKPHAADGQGQALKTAEVAAVTRQ